MHKPDSSKSPGMYHAAVDVRRRPDARDRREPKTSPRSVCEATLRPKFCYKSRVIDVIYVGIAHQSPATGSGRLIYRSTLVVDISILQSA
ncbi:hypothetical protein J6590_007073 [Homalodisca vitripennis]|nr:hypothetical protein J6590_007073 [Homalodisca vitripennis]